MRLEGCQSCLAVVAERRSGLQQMGEAVARADRRRRDSGIAQHGIASSHRQPISTVRAASKAGTPPAE